METLQSQRRIHIVCGTGGVGKTTLSAALCTGFVKQGLSSCVLTVDPARRLMQALGMGASNIQTQCDFSDGLSALQANPLHAKASAFMLTSDHLLEKLFMSLGLGQSTENRLDKNPFFQAFSKRFSGIHEVVALERLLALSQDQTWNKVILDTPPAQNVQAFLEAPQNLLDFLNQPVLKSLIFPMQSFLQKVLKKTSHLLPSWSILPVLAQLTNPAFLQNFVNFSQDLFSLKKTFLSQLNQIQAVLKSSDVGFLVVVAGAQLMHPERVVAPFLEKIRNLGLHFDGFIINQSLSHFHLLDQSFLARFIQQQQQHEQRFLEYCKNKHPIWAIVPAQNENIESLEGLVDVAAHFHLQPDFQSRSR
jgi:arsenite-transporting ATPase